jgi:hypothetical protein
MICRVAWRVISGRGAADERSDERYALELYQSISPNLIMTSATVIVAKLTRIKRNEIPVR